MAADKLQEDDFVSFSERPLPGGEPSDQSQIGQKSAKLGVYGGARGPWQLNVKVPEPTVSLLLLTDPIVVLLLALTVTTIKKVNVTQLYPLLTPGQTHGCNHASPSKSSSVSWIIMSR